VLVKQPAVDFDFALQFLLQFAVSDALLLDGFAGVALAAFFLADFVALGESSLDSDGFTFPRTLRLR